MSGKVTNSFAYSVASTLQNVFACKDQEHSKYIIMAHERVAKQLAKLNYYIKAGKLRIVHKHTTCTLRLYQNTIKYCQQVINRKYPSDLSETVFLVIFYLIYLYLFFSNSIIIQQETKKWKLISDTFKPPFTDTHLKGQVHS